MVNKDAFEGKWNQVKGSVKEKWGKLTDDDITMIRGKRDQLLGKLQERYGYAKEQAEKELATWEQTAGSTSGRGMDHSAERHSANPDRSSGRPERNKGRE